MSSADDVRDPPYRDEDLREILNSVRTIALAGASNKPERPSFEVFGFLLAQGYRVIGVNPALAGTTIHGAPVVESLADLPEPADMIDIFRNSDAAGTVVDEALALRPRPAVIWMQLGVRNDEAASRARALGVKVVMNCCVKIEVRRLSIKKPGV
jgi:predicted CoA-binding protein